MSNIACMIDIETLSSRNDAVILTIGAVRFSLPGDNSPAEIVRHSSFYRRIVPQSNRHIDPQTVTWWMQEDDYVSRNEAFICTDRVSLHETLVELFDFARNCDSYWSHGVTFDLMVLQNAYEQYQCKPPWHYTKMRDTRTLFSLLTKEQQEAVWPDNLFKHHALWDAATQAVAVQRAYKKLAIA